MTGLSMDPLEDLLGESLLDGDDGSLLVDIYDDVYKQSSKVVKSVRDKASKRAERQQQAKARVAQIAAEVAAEAAPDGEEDLAERERELQNMKAEVERELNKGQVGDAVGPEPQIWQPCIIPVKELPALNLPEVPEVTQMMQEQQQLTDTTDDSSSSSRVVCAEAVFTWLLREGGGPLEMCTSEAVARAAFAAVCYATPELALAAYSRFMAWCGEPELIAGAELPDPQQLTAWTRNSSSSTRHLPPGLSMADQRPLVTISWLPGADDVLQALTAMGCCSNAPAPAAAAAAASASGSKRRSQAASSSAAAAPAAADMMDVDNIVQQQQHEQLAYRHANLPLLLRLLARTCRAHAAGRLSDAGGADMSGLVRHQGRLQQLLLSLLALLLDERAQITCRCALPDALSAVCELVPDATWGRIMPHLVEAVSSIGDAGGSHLPHTHRAAVTLLGQLPRSSPRCVSLRQQGALRLMTHLVPGAKLTQGVSSRSSSSSSSSGQARQLLGKQLQDLLGPKDNIRKLLINLEAEGKQRQRQQQQQQHNGQQQQQQQGAAPQQHMWTLLSILDAADLLLWVDVSTPGVGITDSLRKWFIGWLEALDKLLAQKTHTHRVRSRAANMRNLYEFAKNGCITCVAGGVYGDDDDF